jgi:hypothetical protein
MSSLSVKDAHRIRNNPDLILCPVCKEKGVSTWVNRKRMARHLRKHMRGGYMERDVGVLPQKSRSPHHEKPATRGV